MLTPTQTIVTIEKSHFAAEDFGGFLPPPANTM